VVKLLIIIKLFSGDVVIADDPNTYWRSKDACEAAHAEVIKSLLPSINETLPTAIMVSHYCYEADSEEV